MSNLGLSIILSFLTTQVLSTDYPIIVFYDDDECSQAVAVKGFASNDLFQVQGASATQSSCLAALSCIIDESSDLCKQQERTVTAEVVVIVEDDGTIYECDNSNPASEGNCNDFVNPSPCTASSTFDGCFFKWLSVDHLKADPQLLANSSPNPPNIFSYLVFFSDDACTEFEGLRGVMKNSTNTWSLMPSTVSCHDSMACMMQPQGKVCRGLGSIGVINISVQFRDGHTYSCDPSNENVGDNFCEHRTLDTCFRSSVTTNCYARFIQGSELAQHPQLISGHLYVAPSNDGKDGKDDKEKEKSSKSSKQDKGKKGKGLRFL
eukprot:gb/GEZN01011580.1/.p1 GENE.gb/GEZN01011580.1/~~gb/GEZN01011580.1/.p1  ORF type:complete len:320 (-),score=21.68 gb/GEZN01011580.1/:153-1112(-)